MQFFSTSSVLFEYRWGIWTSSVSSPRATPLVTYVTMSPAPPENNQSCLQVNELTGQHLQAKAGWKLKIIELKKVGEVLCILWVPLVHWYHIHVLPTYVSLDYEKEFIVHVFVTYDTCICITCNLRRYPVCGGMWEVLWGDTRHDVLRPCHNTVQATRKHSKSW